MKQIYILIIILILFDNLTHILVSLQHITKAYLVIIIRERYCAKFERPSSALSLSPHPSGSKARVQKFRPIGTSSRAILGERPALTEKQICKITFLHRSLVKVREQGGRRNLGLTFE